MTKLNYKLISTYRTQLMGLAILWVVLYHSTMNASSVPAVGTLQAYGYGGVDVFLLVSGLGLYYAYRGNVSTATFYKRRLQRILPTYLPVVLLFCLLYWGIGEMSFTEVLLNLTTLSFWLGLDSHLTGTSLHYWCCICLRRCLCIFSESGIRLLLLLWPAFLNTAQRSSIWNFALLFADFHDKNSDILCRRVCWIPYRSKTGNLAAESDLASCSVCLRYIAAGS